MSEQLVKPAFLLIDDDANQLEVYVELMRRLGFWHLPILASRTTWLLDLRSNIQHYGINSVITDLNMPNFDGFDVLRTIQEVPHLPKRHLIMISGEVDTHMEHALRCRELNARFLSKPVKLSLLQELITQ